ncbi:hypothetical protein LCGC14_2413620 [marine sediment metagenome]|uniref:UDP-glucose 6-dehydrogenase n=1 Tax=marine sediment metagenome TaxID=412755 RepID=A0A0F9EL43_9ZZZZ
MDKISVIGIGKLGLCFSLVLERAGFDVLGCDMREGYVKDIESKNIKTIEPKVEEYLKQSKNFRATSNFEKTIDHSDLIFITVRTTSLLNGEYDCSQIDKVVEDIKKIEVPYIPKNLVISCNVNPGYSNNVQEELKDYNYRVSYNPEWIAQGSIINDQEYPDLVVIGEQGVAAGDDIEEVYKKMCLSLPVFHRMDRLSAELTKISLNCYLTAKISLANMIGEVALSSGADPDQILDAIGCDKRIGNKFIRYGFGYGGPCFPRDTRSFIRHCSQVGINPYMITAAEETNKTHLKFMFTQFLKEYKNKKEIIEFDSVTYKPGVTIIEESQQLLLAATIANVGYRVLIKEHPDVIKQVKETYGDLFEYEIR